MPLTKLGKDILKSFTNQYGKIKGKKMFYAFMNEHKEVSYSWHKRKK